MFVLIGFVLVFIGFTLIKDHPGWGLLMIVFGGGLLNAIAHIQ